jgi:hypothetical protein
MGGLAAVPSTGERGEHLEYGIGSARPEHVLRDSTDTRTSEEIIAHGRLPVGRMRVLTYFTGWSVYR